MAGHVAAAHVWDNVIENKDVLGYLDSDELEIGQGSICDLDTVVLIQIDKHVPAKKMLKRQQSDLIH